MRRPIPFTLGLVTITLALPAVAVAGTKDTTAMLEDLAADLAELASDVSDGLDALFDLDSALADHDADVQSALADLADRVDVLAENSGSQQLVTSSATVEAGFSFEDDSTIYGLWSVGITVSCGALTTLHGLSATVETTAGELQVVSYSQLELETEDGEVRTIDEGAPSVSATGTSLALPLVVHGPLLAPGFVPRRRLSIIGLGTSTIDVTAAAVASGPDDCSVTIEELTSF